MVEPIEIYRTAKILIDHHGDLALEAARRADAMTAKRDMDGRRTWLEALKAIDEMQGMTPGETRH